MLTSLAVVMACSLGTAGLPAGTAGPAWAAPASDPASSVSVNRADDDSLVAWLAPATPTTSGQPLTLTRSAIATRGSADPATARTASGALATGPVSTVQARSGSAEVGDARAVERSVPTVGISVPAMPQQAGGVPAGRQRALIGLTPATLGSRAPPAR